MFRLNKPKFTFTKRQAFDAITVGLMAFAAIALIALVLFYTVPVKLADIKVPVATDKASYYPSQQIGGIFFGEVYYKGEVRILREVFCKDYHRVIAPPAESSVNGYLFSTQSTPHKLEGTSIPIGRLPEDAPIGANCVIQFTNIYEIKTPFGTRHEEYQYYTQNFSIITKEKRLDLDTQATTDNTAQKSITPDSSSTIGGSNPTNTNSSNQSTNTTNNSTTNNTTNNTNTPPVAPHEVCTINALGIKAFCRTEYY